MSLLMDALRKAEQAKKQAAGPLVAPANPVPPPMSAGEQAAPEPALSLEGREHAEESSPAPPEPVTDAQGVTVQEGDGLSELNLASVEGQEDGSVDAGEIVEVMAEDVVELPEPDGDSGQEAAGGPGPEVVAASPVSGGASSAEVRDTPLAREPQPDISGVPVSRPAMASAESSRQTARAVFAAKKEYQRRSRNRRLLGLGLVGGILLAGVAGFFLMTWRALMPPAVSLSAIEETRGNTPSPDGAPEPEPQPATEGGAGPLDREAGAASQEPVSVVRTSPPPMGDSSPRGASGSAPLPPVSSLPATAGVDAPPSLPVSRDLPVSPDTASEAELPLHAESPSLEPFRPAPASIVISHRSARPQASSLVTAAYDAYQKGDFVQARKSYQQALQDDPKNRGALLGLAAIAMQGHEETLARDLYLRLLDQDPGDPLARAGLLAIAPTGDPARQESELKLLLEQHPRSAPLFFSLGNIYAASQRWNEAQQAYFNALRVAKNDAVKGGRVSPDYPFNLAVTLEHLGQVKPAIQFYHEALELAAGQAAGFDADALAARLQTLDQGERP